MEYVSRITTFGLKMMVKRGPKIFIQTFLHAGKYVSLFHKWNIKKMIFAHNYNLQKSLSSRMERFLINFFRPLFTTIFRPKMVILDTRTYIFHFEQVT